MIEGEAMKLVTGKSDLAYKSTQTAGTNSYAFKLSLLSAHKH